MSEVAEKAAAAERLRRDDAFLVLMQEVRDAQRDVFMDAHSTAEQRDEAHAIVRALAHVDARLSAAIDNLTVEQKGQHRE